MRYRLALTFLSGMLLATASRGDDRTITWFVNDWAPVFIYSKPNPEKLEEVGGYAGEAMNIVARNLSQYAHRLMTSNAGQFWEEIKAGKSLCFATALKTEEREKIVYFTPVQIIPQHHLVVRKSSLQAISKGASSVSLKSLAMRGDLRGSLELNRSYNPVIDAIPDLQGGHLRKVGLPNLGQLTKALDAGHIDYIVEYPIVIESMRQQKPFTNELVTIPLEEAPTPLVTYMVCTKNDWGARVIQDIDKAIRQAAAMPPLRDAVLKRIPVKRMADFKARNNQFFRQRAQQATLKIE